MPSTVLIVDDDAATRAGLAELLRQGGYDPIPVGTFEEAQRVLRNAPPSLLIADVRLGAFNGLQLLVASPHPIPAIIITGFADPVIAADARQHGAEYILKPISPTTLLDLVKRKLASRDSTTLQRRWMRKPVAGGLTAQVEDQPARILDVSYGGLRFEVRRRQEHSVPESLRIRLPASSMPLQARLIWRSPVGEEGWVCGAALSGSTPAGEQEWRALVDAIS